MTHYKFSQLGYGPRALSHLLTIYAFLKRSKLLQSSTFPQRFDVSQPSGAPLSSKEQGGLGIRDLHLWNTACSIKLIWMLFFRAGSIWVAWFKEVVLKGSIQNYWTTKPSSSYSWLANKLLKLRDVVFPLIKLRLENGVSTRFWFDNWTPFGKLTTFLTSSTSRLGIPEKATVASLYRQETWWIPPARTEEQVQMHIYLTTITLSQQHDYYEWEIAGKTSLKYSTGAVYTYLRGERAEVSWAKTVWSAYEIPRHSFLTWLVIQNRCPTKDRLIGWGLQVSPLCVLCNSVPESRNHLFHECPYSHQLWSLSAARCALIPTGNWDATVDQMIGLPRSKSHRPQTLLALLAWKSTIYWTWSERNARLHSNIFRSVDVVFRIIDHQLRNRIQSLRQTNPVLSSAMMQTWFS